MYNSLIIIQNKIRKYEKKKKKKKIQSGVSSELKTDEAMQPKR